MSNNPIKCIRNKMKFVASVRKMGTKGYKIICGNCGSAGPYVKIGDFANKMDAQEKTKEAWNRRENDGKID